MPINLYRRELSIFNDLAVRRSQCLLVSIWKLLLVVRKLLENGAFRESILLIYTTYSVSCTCKKSCASRRLFWSNQNKFLYYRSKSWQQELSKYHRKQRNVDHNRASTVYRHNRVKEMRTTQNRGFIGYGFGGKDNIQ